MQEDCRVPNGREDSGFGRVTRATAVSGRQVPTIQTVLKSSKVLTEFKLVTAKEAKEVIFPAEIDENLAKRDAAFKKQHSVRQPLRRTCLRNNRCAADSAPVPEV